MSACSCGYGECIFRVIRGPHIARKPGHECRVCGGVVEPGLRCVDTTGIDECGDGWFARCHAECWELYQRFKAEVCGYERDESFPIGKANGELHEMAQHALSQGHDPFWREWLELYEQTWEFLEPHEPAALR